MDIDAFVATHQHSWARLGHLTQHARKLASTTPEELDELVALYQRTGSHLAHARIEYGADEAVVGRLTFLVAEAHGVLYAKRSTNVREVVTRFLMLHCKYWQKLLQQRVYKLHIHDLVLRYLKVHHNLVFLVVLQCHKVLDGSS